jgi:hypothetical protein
VKYKHFCEEKVKQGGQRPSGNGVLIFDEVRVVSRLMWNSRSQRVIGMSMTHEDMACLHDVYQTLDEKTKSTNYIMQFLWRDLTSSFDVVGPYYCSSGALECKFIIGVVLETIKIFHVFEFETSLLVCDGASSNLSAIKQTIGVSGVFGRNPSQADPNAIAPSFSNPFNPAKRVYWLICPSHQVLCIVCTCTCFMLVYVLSVHIACIHVFVSHRLATILLADKLPAIT